MQSTIIDFIKNRIRDKDRRRKYVCLLLCLSMLVTSVVIWELRLTGVSMTSTDEPTCGVQEHTHSADCYDADGNLICGLTEHVHTAACYSDSTADVETADVWETTLPQKTGIQADDLVAVAESQLGYQESTRNYAVADDGTLNGYTRYGAWYGNSYGPWNAMFISFCLHYAGISEEQFPYCSGGYAWTAKLQDAGIYRDSSYSPQKGDVVFFDGSNVGVIVSNENGTLTVIAGDYNSGGCVTEFTADAVNVSGYGVLNPKTDAADTPADTSVAEEPSAAASTATDGTAASEPASEPVITPALDAYITGASFADNSGNTINSARSGENVSITLWYCIRAGIITADNLVFTYQLPNGIIASASETAQDVYNNDHVHIGSYRIDENGIITVTFDQNEVDGSEFSGSFTVNGFIDGTGSSVTVLHDTLEIQPAESKAYSSARSDEAGISGYTIYTGNYTTSDGTTLNGYYVMENGVAKTVYCYNHELAQPSGEGTSGYTRYNYFSSTPPEITYVEDGYNTPYPKTKQQVAGLLYAGYPVNGTDYMTKYGASASYAADETQAALWVFARDRVSTNIYDYYTAVSAYGGNTTGDIYGHTGEVTITGDGTITKENGIYRSGTYTVGGSFDGTFWFDNLPSNVTVHDAENGNAMTGLKSGDSFYFEIDGTPSATISLGYTYLDSAVYYYAGSAVVSEDNATSEHPAGSKYQNFIRMEATKNTGSLSLNYTSPPGDMNGPKTSVTVTKTWSDGAEAHAAGSVTVHLYADGISAGNSAILNAGNNWTYTFSELPYYKSGETTPIVYTVTEDAVAKYTVAYTTTSTTGPTVTISSNSVTSFTDGQYYSISSNGYALAVNQSDGNYSLASRAYDANDTAQLWKAVTGGSPEGYNGDPLTGWVYLENVKYPGEWLHFYYKSHTDRTGEQFDLSATAQTTFQINSSGILYTMHYYYNYWFTNDVGLGSNGVSLQTEESSQQGSINTYKIAMLNSGNTAITVTNTAAGYTLANTGGTGIVPFIFVGLMILISAAVILNIRWKKRKPGDSTS